LICALCQNIPLSDITHFIQKREHLNFYCEAHSKHLEEKYSIFTSPIEQFVRNFSSDFNIKIITRKCDYIPTGIEYSPEFENNSNYMNIQADGIDVQAGETHNIDEQLEAINNKKETKEAVQKLEQLENTNTSKSNNCNDDYALEMIASLNYEKDDSMSSIFKN